ncbi:GntR family transcriptional regulator [Xanthobacter sp. DSM 24535]|uniref:GntR family transcriptional regulator n=1 Tax=Roseixanthobacter psychrophilus TaxID=3119917 RepID=UPI003726A43F
MLLRDNLYETIRDEILTCRLMPGEEVREQELASRYEVSRQPVREALLRLERERLIIVNPRQGYQVNPISVSDARDLFRFRLALEPACAAEAIESAPDDVLQALDAFRAFDPEQPFIEYNRAFHCALARASGNARMSTTTCDLIEQADRLVRVSIGAIKGRDPRQLVAEHVAIIDAIQRRDVRTARRLIKTHVASAEKRVLSALSRSAVRL